MYGRAPLFIAAVVSGRGPDWGGREPGPLAGDWGESSEARQPLKRGTRSRIGHVTQVTRHSTVTRIVQPLEANTDVELRR
jgi:hypothetical protein